MKLPIPALALSLALLTPLRAHEAGNEMAAAANNLLAALTPDEECEAEGESGDREFHVL